MGYNWSQQVAMMAGKKQKKNQMYNLNMELHHDINQYTWISVQKYAWKPSGHNPNVKYLEVPRSLGTTEQSSRDPFTSNPGKGSNMNILFSWLLASYDFMAFNVFRYC